ncbi:dienelactone hydrolase family protein [Spirosoma sp. SC4-14]|uniref:dienelactone hydrolase family protein n=1 Tax=Spirosoma sp. SC4-14 TaxID=3128900 RepID=UPI0030CAD923
MNYKFGLLGAVLPLLYTIDWRPFSDCPKTPIQAIQQDMPEHNPMTGKAERRKELYQLLGKLPNRNRPITVTLIDKQETDELIIEKLLLDLNGIEQVPAYFTRPKQQTGKVPVVLFNHSHFGQYDVGKEEFVRGRPEMQKPPYALALARAGYAGLCIDSWCFGERRARGETDTFKEMLWHGQVLWGMMVYDNLRALDYLQTRPEIDPARIATMGMSMGSTMAWWLAALDERIKVCVDLCCLTDYQSLIAAKGLGLHGIYYYVPDLLNHFTTSEINGLISPRPHFGLAGRFDPLTPLDGLAKIDKNLKAIYEQDGAPDAWQLRIYEVGHLETAAMRADILAFFTKWL